jgi:hypothetical protein
VLPPDDGAAGLEGNVEENRGEEAIVVVRHHHHHHHPLHNHRYSFEIITCIVSKTASTALLHLTSAAAHSLASPLSVPPPPPPPPPNPPASLSSGAMMITFTPLKQTNYYWNEEKRNFRGCSA